MQKEKWVDIQGYVGFYQISNLGRVKSLSRTYYTYNYLKKEKIKITRKEKYMSYKKDSNDYMIVSLSRNGKTKAFTIHRLVASAFIPNPDNLPQINHINGIKTDNRVENLEWCTPSYNVEHSFKTGIRKMTSKQIKQAKENIKKAFESKRRKVYQLTPEGEVIKLWDSFTDIYKELHYSWGNIGQVCRGKQELAYGYKWKYKEIKNV